MIFCERVAAKKQLFFFRSRTGLRYAWTFLGPTLYNMYEELVRDSRMNVVVFSETLWKSVLVLGCIYPSAVGEYGLN